MTPALVAAYATCAAPVQRSPDVDAMLTMTPAPCATITGSACLQPRNALFRLWATCASNTSSDISTGPPAAEPPTLLTSTSTLFHLARHACTSAATAALFVASQTCASI